MKRVTFVLENTPAKHFVHWLEYHTYVPGSFPVEHGQGEIFLKGPKFLGHIEGPTQIDMGVYYIEPDRDETAYAAVLSGEVDDVPSWDRKRVTGVFYFDIIQIGPDTEVTAWCGVSELMEYYKGLLLTIADRWQSAAEQIEEALGTPTPLMSAACGTDVQIGILSLPLEPQKVYRHSVNLCNKDGRFAILNPKPTDEWLEKLLVFDAQKLKKANSDAEASDTVIGTVRLLPGVGDGTTVIFDAKDAVWHQEIAAEKRGLFHEFFQRSKDYWKRLLAGEIKPAEERDTTPTPAEGGAGTDGTLDPIDREIIKIVPEIECGGRRATDELVAARLPPNPKTGESYHRVTVNRRRCKLRDRGFKV